ncbi:MAG TPA: hypothetical protein VHE33_02935 [Acidobacteriaceae bacterium]|nr:hypothetical protein [Acidobacteriaceae bacterium]
MAASDEPAQDRLRPGTSGILPLPEIFFAVVILPLVAIAIVEAHRSFLHSPGADWNSSEWMIDYAAGFMRRGQGGTVLLRLLGVTGWSFFAVVSTLTTTAYLGLCAIATLVTWRSRGPAIWRLVFLFNPLLLLAAAEYGSFARKDIFFLWGTLLHVWVCDWVLKRHKCIPSERTRLALLEWTVVLTTSVLLAALHEGLFLFIWLPMNAVIAAWGMRQLYPGRTAKLSGLAMAFAPSLAVAFASIRRHGDAATAQAICQSWRVAFPVNCTPGPQFPKAIDALAWSMRRDVLGCLHFVWTAGNFYLVIFAVLATLAVAVLLIAVLALEPSAKLEHLLAIATGSLVCAVPLFVLGTDWGRWLFLAGTSSVIVMMSATLRPALYGVLPATAQRFFDRTSRSTGARLGSLRNLVERHPGLSLTLLLMLPLPALPIASAMLLANPLLIVIDFLARIHGS